MLEREKKRNKLVISFFSKRQIILKTLKKTKKIEDIFVLNEKIQKLPRNSSSIRLRNRCWQTGKARGYNRFFGLCRNSLRKLAHEGFLPGITKASW